VWNGYAVHEWETVNIPDDKEDDDEEEEDDDDDEQAVDEVLQAAINVAMEDDA
jgi:hypothetical protein